MAFALKLEDYSFINIHNVRTDAIHIFETHETIVIYLTMHCHCILSHIYGYVRVGCQGSMRKWWSLGEWRALFFFCQIFQKVCGSKMGDCIRQLFEIFAKSVTIFPGVGVGTGSCVIFLTSSSRLLSYWDDEVSIFT